MEISSQKYSFVVEREVVRVTADMLDNYALELWMESKGFRCRTNMTTEARGIADPDFSWPPTYPGIYFTPFSDPEAETVYAYVNDYLVFSGYGQVEVMKSVDFNKAQPKLID
jgi:hypothetical protein